MNTLLIANRGEIALRVMRTARRLGWRTVAIHTDLDVAAPHVAAADVTVLLDSYLDVAAVVAAARESGAAYVHPGYGFLSERAPFARALAEAGLTLVGPTAEVMDAMGRKDAAREIAVAASVPVVPSYDVDTPADEISFPVLVKAAAGGGGKGMRVVRSAEELPEAMAAAAREASSSFGDDTLLVEKYVESGRHVEVQVFGDQHGGVRHFFERDCSTQRRHQKVLEEAPAPTITAAQREAMTGAAVALAAQVGYTGAGTVEFLLDNDTGEFYFLEMNTRLQVEHPVTEEVVRVRGERVDLVEQQLRIAAGEAFDFDQVDVTLDGHAVEARVYAEDPFNGFLPQAGRATHVHWPGGADQPHVRVDHALTSGQVISTAYDPMLGKVIAWGPDRAEAIAALVGALDRTEILGLTTNTGFLRFMAATREFAEATITTATLDQHPVSAPSPDGARALAAYSLAPEPTDDPDPWRADGWRSAGSPAAALIELDRLVAVSPTALDGAPAHLLTRHRDGEVERLGIVLDGVHHEGAVLVRGHDVEVVHRGQRFVLRRPDPFAERGADQGDGTLAAPMPGTVLDVRVSAGQRVDEGETLGVIEAMKMELAIKAPFAGEVTTVAAAVGDQIALGATLFVVEEA